MHMKYGRSQTYQSLKDIEVSRQPLPFQEQYPNLNKTVDTLIFY